MAAGIVRHIVAALTLLAAGSSRLAAQPPAEAALAENAPAETPSADDSTQPTAVEKSALVRDTLTLRMVLAGANVDDSAGGAGAGAGAAAGYHNDADVLLTYGRHARRMSFRLTAQSIERYEAARGDVTTVNDRAGIDFSVTGSKTMFHLTETASYSPLYQFGALPDASPSPAVDAAQAHGDYANAGVSAYTSATAVDLGRSLGRYSMLTMSYARRDTRFSGSDPGFTAQTAGFQLTHRLTRHASLHAGYGYEFGGGGSNPTARTHNIDVGIGYGGAITSSGRTLLSISSGSAVVVESQTSVYHLSSDASLTRLIGRTGSARVTYRRGVQLLEGFAGPVMFDAVNAAIGASLARRVSASATGGYNHGALAVGATSGYGTITAAAGLRWMLSRQSTFEAGYFYYRQRGADAALTAPGPIGPLDRQGVRFSVSWDASLRRSKG